MNTTLTLILDTRRKRRDNSYPIILRLIHLQQSTSISTGFSVQKKYWDNIKKKIRNTYNGTSSVGRINSILIKQRANSIDIINKLHDRGELSFLSLVEVKEKIAQKSKYDSFYLFGESLIDELTKSRRYGTARSYAGLLGIMMVFTKEKDLKFNEVNYNFLKRFEQFHLSKKGNTLNGLASYLRVLRAIYNKGVKEGLIDGQAYPFEKYRIKTTPTEKRAIDIKYIREIFELKLDKNQALYHYRNYFLLSYMLFGISFVDLAFLKIANIVDGRIRFQRKKTSKHYDIKLTDQINKILKIYTKGKSDTDFIFSIIKRDTLELQYKDVEWARHRYNKGLKKIGELCGIEQRLTSYVSRHSFATQAMLQDIPLSAISSMLGHSKLSTTQIYLKSLPSEILDSYQERLNNI